jgi:hypothetical protein
VINDTLTCPPKTGPGENVGFVGCKQETLGSSHETTQVQLRADHQQDAGESTSFKQGLAPVHPFLGEETSSAKNSLICRQQRAALQASHRMFR